jgi:hypothetical protein
MIPTGGRPKGQPSRFFKGVQNGTVFGSMPGAGWPVAAGAGAYCGSSAWRTQRKPRKGSRESSLIPSRFVTTPLLDPPLTVSCDDLGRLGPVGSTAAWWRKWW